MKKINKLILESFLVSVIITLIGCGSTPLVPPPQLTPAQVSAITTNVVNDLCAIAPTAATIAVVVEQSTNAKADVQGTTNTVTKAVSSGCQAIQTSTTSGAGVVNNNIPVIPATGTIVVTPAASTP